MQTGSPARGTMASHGGHAMQLAKSSSTPVWNAPPVGAPSIAMTAGAALRNSGTRNASSSPMRNPSPMSPSGRSERSPSARRSASPMLTRQTAPSSEVNATPWRRNIYAQAGRSSFVGANAPMQAPMLSGGTSIKHPRSISPQPGQHLPRTSSPVPGLAAGVGQVASQGFSARGSLPAHRRSIPAGMGASSEQPRSLSPNPAGHGRVAATRAWGTVGNGNRAPSPLRCGVVSGQSTPHGGVPVRFA